MVESTQTKEVPEIEGDEQDEMSELPFAMVIPEFGSCGGNDDDHDPSEETKTS